MAIQKLLLLILIISDLCSPQSIQLIDLKRMNIKHDSFPESKEPKMPDSATLPIPTRSSKPPGFSLSGSSNGSSNANQTEPGHRCGVEQDAQVNVILSEQIMPTYNKQTLPNSTGSVEIKVEIQINAIPHFSELDSFFELDLFFSELWHEPRLAFSHLPQAKCVKNVTLGLDYLQRIWTPNICIVNSKAALIHSSPSENVFLILYEDGTLWKNCRMLVRGPCEIDLRLFPFDVQSCSLIFESYSFNSQKLSLRWFEAAAIRLAQTIELPDFFLSQYIANKTIVSYPNGQWDQLKATFIFNRRYGFFIMQVYLPTYMTVFVAWINFWMDSKELSTRSTLAISAFLAMCLQLGTVQANQPRVSYVKAMDVWMLGAISFLFFALVELAIISYILRSDKDVGEKGSADKKKRFVYPYIPPSPTNYYEFCEPKVALAHGMHKRPKHGPRYHEVPRPNCAGQCHNLCPMKKQEMSCSMDEQGSGYRPQYGFPSTSYFQCWHDDSKRESVSKMQRCSAYAVDKFFLIVYPPAFLIFNIFYWTYYLN